MGMNDVKEQVAAPTAVKKMRVPNPLVIIACIVFFGAVLSYFIPAGVFDRVKDPGTGRMIADPNTFKYVAQNPTKFFSLFLAFPKGFKQSSSIIAFLFIIGGAFGIMEKTGAVMSAMSTLVRKMEGREILLVPVCMLMFTLGATFAGMNEEYLAFLPLLLSVCFAMGFDSITALGMVLGSSAAGYGAGCTNAFTVGVAQGISGLPLFSGIGLRSIILVVLYILNASFITFYAFRVKKNPKLSPMYELDKANTNRREVSVTEKMTKRHLLILLTFCVAIVILVIGVIKAGFYIEELAALFLIMGIVMGLIGKLSPNQMADGFMKGCATMLLPCIVVGACRAITVVFTEAKIMDTIVFFFGNLLKVFPPYLTAFGMFMVQDALNILIPSGSGQAAVTMPIMAPLADIVGMTRQTAVLAFQFGDTFTNCITPASGMTVSCLTITGVPIKTWWKFILPLFLCWWVVAFIFLSYASHINYGPF